MIAWGRWWVWVQWAWMVCEEWRISFRPWRHVILIVIWGSRSSRISFIVVIKSSLSIATTCNPIRSVVFTFDIGTIVCEHCHRRTGWWTSWFDSLVLCEVVWCRRHIICGTRIRLCWLTLIDVRTKMWDINNNVIQLQHPIHWGKERSVPKTSHSSHICTCSGIEDGFRWCSDVLTQQLPSCFLGA